MQKLTFLKLWQLRKKDTAVKNTRCMSPTYYANFRGYIISCIPANHTSSTIFYVLLKVFFVSVKLKRCTVQVRSREGNVMYLYCKHPKPLVLATIYCHNVDHPICGNVIVANWDVSEVNSSPEEVGRGAIPTMVGNVQGDDVGDGPVASPAFRGKIEDSLVLVDGVAW